VGSLAQLADSSRAGWPLAPGGTIASRRERAEALRLFAGRIRTFQDEALIGLERLRSDLSYTNIDEEDRATFSPEFESAASVLTEVLELTFEAQRIRLSALADGLDVLDSDAVLPSFGSAASRHPQRAHAIGSGFTGETIHHGKEAFDVWSFAGPDPACIDWGADAHFPEKFNTERWKGREADDYRELMKKTPTLLAQCRASGTVNVTGELALARDAYFGSDRVRLEVAADGKVSVVNGRHRVMAAIECGASIPVSVWRADDPSRPRVTATTPLDPTLGPDFRERTP
jgi:hypothetical protein